ncbi:unnamed protein product [Symbiodinium microadriaticum]|nr:unnamed protein product [Symbiodinium sp. KB8]CAE7431061.1 unnamed protein product [Symbiodinium microadriaticum]
MATKIDGHIGFAGDLTPTTASDTSAAGSPNSSEPASPKRTFMKNEVLAWQQELLQEFSSPAFQKRLRQASSLQAAEYEKARTALVRDAHWAVAPQHGFPATDSGIEQMLLAVDQFLDDMDVSVNQQIIQEHLVACEVPAPFKEQTALPLGHDKKALGRRDVVRLLKSLQVSFSEPNFQQELAKLKESDMKASGIAEAEGFLQLPGRNELAFAIQEQLAPCFGFEASKQGILAMISTCAQFLMDPEIAELFDAVNMKLGMTPEACKAFREKVLLRTCG